MCWNTANNIKFHYRSKSLTISLNSIFFLFLAHNTQLHKDLSHHAKIQGNLMIQWQENTQTDGKMEGLTDPISQDPSGYCQGSNKYNCSRLAFKSQRYWVRFWSDKKLSMKKISSIHTLVLWIEQILVSHKLDKYSCSGPTTFISGSCRLRFSLLFLCSFTVLYCSDANYVNKEY